MHVQVKMVQEGRSEEGGIEWGGRESTTKSVVVLRHCSLTQENPISSVP